MKFLRSTKVKSKASSWTYRIIAFMIGIGVLLALIYYAGFERFWGIILQTSPYWIAVSVIVYAGSWVFRTWRLKRFTTHAGKNIEVFDLFKLYVSGYALNSVLPARLGDAATMVYLKMKGIGIGMSAAIVLQSKLLDALALVLLSMPACISFFTQATATWIATPIAFGVVVVAIPVGIVILDRKRKFSLILEQLESRCSVRFLGLAAAKTRDTYQAYHQIVSNKKLMVISILLSLAMGLLEGLTCYAISTAVGTRISIIVVLLAVSMANIGKGAPITPGGIGIYESILAGILVLSGVAFDVASVVAIMDHGIKKVFNLMFGIPATASIGIRIAEIRKVAADRKGCPGVSKVVRRVHDS